jgi:hypothetical protein
MSDTQAEGAPGTEYSATGSANVNGARYSLKEMMDEVKIERQESVFGRELVDTTEIDKMFSKQIRKKKRK